MKNSQLKQESNDLYTFYEENSQEELRPQDVWKILVIGKNESFVDRVKTLIQDFIFQEKKIELLLVESLEQAKKTLASVEATDIALIMLPVSQLKDTSIEQFIKFIREDLKNNFLRIILYSDVFNEKFAPLLIKYDISSYLIESQINKVTLFATFSAGLHALNCLQQQQMGEKKFLNMLETINRFIPQTFLKILGKKDISEINLTDHIEQEVAVLFFDIRGFTSLSELLTPLETFDFINNFISYLEPHIAANKGYVDKYIGDSFMALFPESADDAIKAGINMLRSLEIYNYQRISKYQSAVKIGIGINTGEAVMGVIGFYDRMECTAVSSAVNAASRLEGLTKILGASLLISSTTFKAIKDPEQFNFRSLGNVKAVGRREIIHVYEVFDADPEEMIEMKKATKAEFEQGVKLIQKGELLEANEVFTHIIAKNPNDLAAQYMLTRTSKK